MNDADHKSRGTYAYSNLGYSVLGIVVERVSVGSFESFMQERFFEPFGLKQIGYTVPDLTASLGPTVCYVNGVRQRPIAENISELNGAFWNLKGNGGLQALREGKAITRGNASNHAVTVRSKSAGSRRVVRIWLECPGRLGGSSHQASPSGSDGACWAAVNLETGDDGFIYLTGNSDTQESSEIASALLRLWRDARQHHGSSWHW